MVQLYGKALTDTRYDLLIGCLVDFPLGHQNSSIDIVTLITPPTYHPFMTMALPCGWVTGHVDRAQLVAVTGETGVTLRWKIVEALEENAVHADGFSFSLRVTDVLSFRFRHKKIGLIGRHTWFR